MKLTKSILRSMDPLMRMVVAGPEKAMETLRDDLQYKVNRKIRELPGTDNEYKKQLRADRRRMQALIAATGCTSYEDAVKWIKAQRRH